MNIEFILYDEFRLIFNEEALTYRMFSALFCMNLYIFKLLE
ncbi:hypothetical protein AM1_1878 [Acaryochloris marina MBIC11017]|uniref:Uncharacterized protein n=1 Tax=Acaryochloris marina (strain MBIC 11017) TaxID=329726 RepID=B0CDH3_ACAM1|nr:hypothetical protein AM1_1878 [Acaryochloris marina MBIC11017]